MKKFKKVFAVLLTLAMVLGMSMTSFAESTAKITVSNLQVDDSQDTPTTATILKYVQIVEPDQNSAIGWKFSDPTYATEFMSAYGVDTADKALEMIKQQIADRYASTGAINSDSRLSTALTALKSKASDESNIERKGTSAEITVNKAGLYLIVASDTGYTYIPMLAFVAADGASLKPASVVAKGSKDQVIKDVTDGGQSVEPNQVVEYNATVEYPFYAPNRTDRVFKITDQLTNAEFVIDAQKTKSVSITDEEDKPVSITDDEISFSDDKTLMTINFNYNPDLAGKVITITYSVKVDADITTDDTNGLKNNISSTINSEDGSEVETTYEVVSKPVTFKVIKTGEKGVGFLSGAQFTIYTADAEDKNILDDVATIENNGTTLYPVRVSGDTDDQGEYTFNNLSATKKYYVKETQAPKGYSLRDDVYELTGATLTSSTPVNNVKTYVYSNFSDQRVEDSRLSSLPSTGGIGTTIFTIGGCAIMIIAAALFFASRRKAAK